MNFIERKALKAVSPQLPDLVEQYAGLSEPMVDKELEGADWALNTNPADNTTQLSMKTACLGKLEISLTQAPGQQYRTKQVDFYVPNGEKFPRMEISPIKTKILLKLFGRMLPKGLAELAGQCVSLTEEDLAKEIETADWNIRAAEENTRITMKTEKFGALEIVLSKTPDQKYRTKVMSFYTPKGEEFPLYPISQDPTKRVKGIF